jgi:hypothetical protein
MVNKHKGVLKVGHNENGEIVVNHPDLHPDENGVGHIIFSRQQARLFALLLLERVGMVEEELRIKSIPPVDRTARVLLDGSPVTEDHREILSSGQQKDYVVLSAEERGKGFVRPLRRSYRHKTCNTMTTMGIPLAETYARDPGFYSGTFCVNCKSHFPLDQFVWEGTEEQLGS